MNYNEKKADNQLLLGTIILAVSGVLLGLAIGYVVLQYRAGSTVLAQMQKEGYVITEGGDATSSDVVKGKSVYVNGQYIEGSKVVLDTSDATANSEKIAEGKSLYINNQLVIGKMPIITKESIKPAAVGQSLSAGSLVINNIIIRGDENLIPENIRKGVNIFNVVGNY